MKRLVEKMGKKKKSKQQQSKAPGSAKSVSSVQTKGSEVEEEEEVVGTAASVKPNVNDTPVGSVEASSSIADVDQDLLGINDAANPPASEGQTDVAWPVLDPHQTSVLNQDVPSSHTLQPTNVEVQATEDKVPSVDIEAAPAVSENKALSPRSVRFSEQVTFSSGRGDSITSSPEKPSARWNASFDDDVEGRRNEIASSEKFQDVPWSPDAPTGSKSIVPKISNTKLSPQRDQVPSEDDGLTSPQERTTLLTQTEKTTKPPKKSPGPTLDEEQGLTELEDAEPSPALVQRSGRFSMLRSSICARRPCLTCVILFLLSLIIARGIGKSSSSSLSLQTSENRENPVKQAADENVRRLNGELAARHKPVIISTIGSNGDGLLAVQAVLARLGMQIPDKVSFPGLVLETKDGSVVKAGFKRVLDAALTPEKGIAFDERSVASSSSLVEWHLGRAFVAGFVNATIHSIPDDKKSERWGFSHPRAGYLLPYYRSVFGPDNFVFIHVVKNGVAVTSRVYEEFRHMCELMRFTSYCTNTFENKLSFWAQMNEAAFKWAKHKLDVDHYLVVRTEDFSNGNIACISRLAKVLGLKASAAEVADAALAGKKAKEVLEGGEDELSMDKTTEIMNGLPDVKKQLEFWGYDPNDPTKMSDCEKMSWF